MNGPTKEFNKHYLKIFIELSKPKKVWAAIFKAQVSPFKKERTFAIITTRLNSQAAQTAKPAPATLIAAGLSGMDNG